jgi:hypothetical protein
LTTSETPSEGPGSPLTCRQSLRPADPFLPHATGHLPTSAMSLPGQAPCGPTDPGDGGGPRVRARPLVGPPTRETAPVRDTCSSGPSRPCRETVHASVRSRTQAPDAGATGLSAASGDQPQGTGSTRSPIGRPGGGHGLGPAAGGRPSPSALLDRFPGGWGSFRGGEAAGDTRGNSNRLDSRVPMREGVIMGWSQIVTGGVRLDSTLACGCRRV